MHIVRRLIQFAFLALIVVGVFVLRRHCEWWCPFGAVEGIHAYVVDGSFPCSLGVTNLFVFGGVIVSVLLIRRAFCGYLCPIGTLSDWAHSLGRLLRLPKLNVGSPADPVISSLKEPMHSDYFGIRIVLSVDRILSMLKYVVLGVLLYFTWTLGEVIFRAYCPAYAAISRHGEDITFWAYTILGTTVGLSLFISMPFCRWFCPLAAVMNPLSKLGLTRVRRDGGACIDCGKCAKACPMAIPVDKMEEASASRCISCLECVNACPKKKDGALTWGPPRSLGSAWPTAALVGILAFCMAATVIGALWFPLPSFTKTTPAAVPEKTATLELAVRNCGCRGNANLLWYFVTRDDDYALSEYVKLEAWPSPELARIRVTYDPTHLTEHDVKMAIVEPYLELEDQYLRNSPFEIEGFNPVKAYLPGSEMPMPAPMPEIEL